VRICAVSLPELRVEVVRGETSRSPLGIVVAPPPLDESKLLGNMRLDVVSRSARALGVRRGQTIAQARARAGGALVVRVVRPEAVKDVLARLAEVALAFGATVAFAADSGDHASFGDVIWVEVTGCAHLFGGGVRGEALLAARLAGVIASHGHACSVAIADGPRVAALLARHAVSEAAPEVVVVPPGENAAALAELPVAALPLGKDHVRWLAKVGVHTIGEMRSLPRAGLASRLGADAREILALVAGDDRAPLTPFVPPEIPEEEASFEYAIESSEALVFVAKTLTDRLASRLAGRASCTSRIELELVLDAAMIAEGTARTDVVALDLPAPLYAAADLLAALRTRLEKLVLRAPVTRVKLRALGLVHKREALLSLFEPEPAAERALPRLVAELAADIGGDAIGKLTLGDAWTPADRSCFVRLDATPSPKSRRKLLSSVPEPTRLLAVPVTIARDRVRIVRHLTRLETTAWWKRAPKAAAVEGAVDYVMASTDEGTAFVAIDRKTSTTRICGWFD
jgi:protein ImuB